MTCDLSTCSGNDANIIWDLEKGSHELCRSARSVVTGGAGDRSKRQRLRPNGVVLWFSGSKIISMGWGWVMMAPKNHTFQLGESRYPYIYIYTYAPPKTHLL